MTQRHIGILPVGSEEWVAGATYVQNIIRALSFLPKEEQPKLYFLCHYKEDDHPIEPSLYVEATKK